MLDTGLAMTVYRSSLKKIFEFDKINSVEFCANVINDTLDLSGLGVDKKTKEICSKKMKQLKLSDNSNVVDMVFSKIKNILGDCKIDLMILKIDFENKKTSSDVFYEKDNKKERINFNDIKI